MWAVGSKKRRCEYVVFVGNGCVRGGKVWGRGGGFGERWEGIWEGEVAGEEKEEYKKEEKEEYMKEVEEERRRKKEVGRRP